MRILTPEVTVGYHLEGKKNLFRSERFCFLLDFVGLIFGELQVLSVFLTVAI